MGGVHNAQPADRLVETVIMPLYIDVPIAPKSKDTSRTCDDVCERANSVFSRRYVKELDSKLRECERGLAASQPSVLHAQLNNSMKEVNQDPIFTRSLPQSQEASSWNAASGQRPMGPTQLELDGIPELVSPRLRPLKVDSF